MGNSAWFYDFLQEIFASLIVINGGGERRDPNVSTFGVGKVDAGKE